MNRNCSIFSLGLLAFFSYSLLGDEFKIQILKEENSIRDEINSSYEMEFFQSSEDREKRLIEFSENEFSTDSIPTEKSFRIRQIGKKGVKGFWSQIYATEDFIVKEEKTENKKVVVPSPPTEENSISTEDIFVKVEKEGKKLLFLNTKSILIEANKDKTIQTKTYYRLNNGDWILLSPEGLVFKEDGEYQMDYYTIDSLGNKETPQSVVFLVDNVPPVTKLVFPRFQASIGGDVFTAGDGMIYADVEDKVSGKDTTYYRIVCKLNEEKPFQVMKEGVEFADILTACEKDPILEYYSTDKVGNKEKTKFFIFQYNKQ